MGWTTGRPRCTGCVVGALWFDAGMVSTGGEDALKRARTALASGRLTLARDILEDHVHLHRDAEAFKMLGEIRHRIGDLPGAGAAWFATSAKGPIVDEAVSAWRTKHDDDFAAMWATIPASARRGELTPKLAALKARAEAAAPSPEPSPSLSTSPDPSPAPASTARAKAPKKVAPEPAATAPPVAVPQARAADPVRAPRTDEAAADRSVPEAQSGFDAAKVIAWVLAALFVVCAVVGLITILQWLVPGT